MKIIVSWDVATCGLVEVHHCFRNISKILSNYMVQHPRRQSPSLRDCFYFSYISEELPTNLFTFRIPAAAMTNTI
jgi:hypothetical protein